MLSAAPNYDKINIKDLQGDGGKERFGLFQFDVYGKKAAELCLLMYKKCSPEWLLFIALILSSIFFYWQMQIETYTAVLFLVTLLLLCLFYSLFSQKWIPFAIHVVLSVLQFADVVHNAYFNGYLSLNMLGSARYLGDVTDVIAELIRPGFFSLFLWIPPAALAIYKAGRESTDLRISIIFGCCARRPLCEKVSRLKTQAASRLFEWFPARFLTLHSSHFLNFVSDKIPALRTIDEVYGKKVCRRVLGTAIFLLFLANPMDIPFVQSVGNLEFLSFHIRDAAGVCFGISDDAVLAEAVNGYASDEDDPLYGLGEGKNLIVIQVEGLQNFVIGREYNGAEITPHLNSLVRSQSLYFDHYYMQIGAGNTSDAEFATNNSLYGSNKSYTYEIYQDNAFRGLPWLLMEKGYETAAMHAYKGEFWSRDLAYPKQGFQFFVSADGYKGKGKKTAWGVNDEDFLEESVDYLCQLRQPFYSFLVTLSSHTPFELPKGLQKYANVKLKKEHRNTRFGNYLVSISYADHAIGQFIETLKDAGLYENSIIAIYGDHFGLAIEDDRNAELMEEFLGKPYRFDSVANVPLIIHIPGEAAGTAGLPRTVSKAGGQMDFMPTITYLMGFETLDTLYLGSNLLDGDEGFVIQDRYAPPGSFLTDEIAYLGAGDGVFETGRAWNIDTGEKVSLSGKLKEKWQRARGLLNLSAKYLEEDTVRRIYYADGSQDRVDTKAPTSPKNMRNAESVQRKQDPVKSELPETVTESAIQEELVPDVTAGEGELDPSSDSDFELGLPPESELESGDEGNIGDEQGFGADPGAASDSGASPDSNPGTAPEQGSENISEPDSGMGSDSQQDGGTVNSPVPEESAAPEPQGQM